MINNPINFDLHIHSAASSKYEAKKIVSESTQDNLTILLKKLDENKINVFSITDHNVFDKDLYLKAKKEIQKFKNIKNIIAGVEFNVEDAKYKKNVHLRIYFDISNHSDAEKLEEGIKKFKTQLLEKENKKVEDENFKFDWESIRKIIEYVDKNVIFIFDQNKCLESENQTKKEAGNWNFLYDNQEWGIVTAIETRQRRSKNIIEMNKRQIDSHFGIIYGSDCHSWKFYPAHSQERKPREKFYFSSHCRPTFLGLMLTIIFEKRLYKNFSENSFIEKIKIGNNKIDFSRGINVIIGDNGVGKSSLLGILKNETNKPQKKYAKEHNIEYDANSKLEIKKISQGMLVEKHKKNTLLIDKFKEESEIKNNLLEKFNKISLELLSWIDSKIKYNFKKNNALGKNYPLRKPLDNYFPTTNKIDDLKNEYQDRQKVLKQISELLKNEFDYSIYSNYKVSIDLIFEKLDFILKEIRTKKKEKYYKVQKYQLINRSLKIYEEETHAKSTTEEKQNKTLINNQEEFISSLIDFIFAKSNNEDFPKIKTTINKDEVKVEKQEKSYSLSLEYEELSDLNLLEKIKERIFKKGFEWNKITNFKYLSDNLKNKAEDIDNWNAFKIEYNNKFQKQIIEKCSKYSIFIKDIETDKIARTFGEMSKLYYQNIFAETSQNFHVIMIDQPEDNISPLSIKNSICKTIENLSGEKQLFIVTHNPLIAVNLDPDLVIFLKQVNQNLEIVFGPLDLEDGEMIEIISKNMDGGREVVNERLKIYESK